MTGPKILNKFIETHIFTPNQPLKLQNEWVQVIDYLDENLENSQLQPTVIKKARQIGASTITRAFSLALALTRDNTRILLVHPALHLAHVSGRELNNFILDAPRGTTKKRNGTLKSVIEERIPWEPNANTILFKRINNDSWIRFDTIGRDACRLRGITADVIIFDEAQDMMAAPIRTTLKTLCMAKIGGVGSGVQVFAFTPHKESYMDTMWDKSSKDEYHWNCPGCRFRFPLTMKNWEKVWLEGCLLKCPSCDEIFDKRMASGQWLGEAKRDIKGFHFHQGLIDIFTKDDIIKAKERLSPEMFACEVWGEYYKG